MPISLVSTLRSFLTARAAPKATAAPKAAALKAMAPPDDPWGSPVKWRQYLGQPSPFTISNPAWQLFANDQGATIMSMLSRGEAAVCYTLAKDHWTGAGEIVDLGCLMGLSTHSFALGVAQNERVSASAKKSRISCYDLFLSSDLGLDFALWNRVVE